jgi:hypothetical protein
MEKNGRYSISELNIASRTFEHGSTIGDKADKGTKVGSKHDHHSMLNDQPPPSYEESTLPDIKDAQVEGNILLPSTLLILDL